MTQSFEQIASLLEGMDAPNTADHFRIDWLAERNIGVGKDSSGSFAILLVGEKLAAAQPSVQRSMRHGTWKTESGREVEANLLSLPAGEEFLTAAAAIIAELVRRGAAERPMVEVFSEVEEFVALVLRRVLLPPEFVLGLVGELLVLTELLKALRAAGRSLDDPTAMWRGWMQQSRDFVLAEAAIEIKTTGLHVSRHRIQGLEQVEARKLDGDAVERLFLGSIGLRRAAAGLYSVSGLTSQILRQLALDDAPEDDLNDAQQKFLDRLTQYGPPDSSGYTHAKMSELEPYREAYTTTFPPRFYDMSDENIRVIRSADLAETFPHVLTSGIAYSIELPPTVAGSIDNPRPEFRQLLRTLVDAS